MRERWDKKREEREKDYKGIEATSLEFLYQHETSTGPFAEFVVPSSFRIRNIPCAASIDIDRRDRHVFITYNQYITCCALVTAQQYAVVLELELERAGPTCLTGRPNCIANRARVDPQ